MAMCYEERYISEWANKAERKREERRSRIDRGPSARPPDSPKPATAAPKEVERELEAV
jgi:hypothetical protein